LPSASSMLMEPVGQIAIGVETRTLLRP